MSKVGGKAFDFKLFTKVMAYARPYRGLFWGSVVLTVMASESCSEMAVTV